MAELRILPLFVDYKFERKRDGEAEYKWCCAALPIQQYHLQHSVVVVSGRRRLRWHA